MEMRVKKSLGQNFLKDAEVLGRIIKTANLSKDDVVIEVGSGHGALTELLAGVCKKVIAIELDDRLIPILQEKFKDNANVEIIHGDILKLNLPDLISRYKIPARNATHSVAGGQDTRYKVVANLPYYITSPIVRLFLETRVAPCEMIFMVQKEVAERICAKKGEMSILAVSVQYYARAEFLFTVFKESFEPVPKVDSAVLKLSSIFSSPFGRGCHSVTGEGAGATKEETKKFFRIVKSGFSAKRKTLINNLSNGLGVDKKEIEEKLLLIGFGPNTRAQELGVEDWEKLSKKF